MDTTKVFEQKSFESKKKEQLTINRSKVPEKYTQTLLGHSSIKTTEIYTHISKDALNKVESPLDSMMTGDDLFNCKNSKNRLICS